MSSCARVPRGRGLRDPDVRDRLYDLLEHDPLAYSAGSRFIQLIIGVIVLNVTAMILASVPELDAQFGALFAGITILSVLVFALEYAARLWTVAGHTPRQRSALADRLSYAFSALGIIDLMAFLPAAIVLATGRHATLAALGVLPFFKLIRYSPAMRSLLAAVHAERRALIGCVVILIGAVLTFASLLYAIERDVPTLADHVRTTAKARLADTGDLALAELVQAEREGGARRADRRASSQPFFRKT